MSKTHKTFREQAELLQSRGMVIPVLKHAEEILEGLPYYKIKEFAEPYWDESTNKYVDKCTLSQVFVRHLTDKKLRYLLFECIDSLELMLKTRISYLIGEKYGATGYWDFSNWATTNIKKTKITQEQNKFRKLFLSQLKNGNNELYKKYTNSVVPIWEAVNYMTLGNKCVLLEHMCQDDLEVIASHFDCQNNEFISWVNTLKFVRNICVHGGNIIDIVLRTSPVRKREIWDDVLYIDEHGNSSNRLALVLLILISIPVNVEITVLKEIFAKIAYLVTFDISPSYYGFKDENSFLFLQNFLLKNSP